MSDNLKNSTTKGSGGLARAVVSLILSVSAAIAAAFAVSLAVTVIQGLHAGDLSGGIGAAFGLIFLLFCTPLSAAFAIPAIILGKSALKRVRRGKEQGCETSGGALPVGISGLSLGALSLVTAVVSFIVALIFAILQ